MEDGLADFIISIIFICIAVSVPLIGIFGGRISEYQHFRSLVRREEESNDVIVTQLKSFPAANHSDQPPSIVYAETVIASDYLKTLLAKIRGIFGGEVRSFQKMQERSRRETLLRLIKSAREQGYNAICNVRLETADVGGGAMTPGKNAMPMACILGSATAYHASTSR